MNASTTNPADTSGITLAALTKRYGDNTVVDAIDLTVEQGEFMTFLGPSGSGKTTTLNMIAGFTAVDSGSIEIHGQPMSRTPPHKRDIGMVFQSYALFPHKTVAENIAYPLQRRKITGDSQRTLVREALEMVRLGDFGDRYPSELSGGQQQRAALARALVYQPRVLLMDEPLGALDRKLREWLQSEIKRIHREVHSTFVYVTHDQEEALSMSDRIAVFNNGRIEQVGTARELYENPRTLFVGRFIGESTVFTGAAETVGPDMTAIDFHRSRLLVPGRTTGPRAAVLIRPERLGLTAASNHPRDGVNSVSAQISDVTYLGSVTRYTVQAAGGIIGIARLPHDATAFELGQQVAMTWPVDSGVILQPDNLNTTPTDDEIVGVPQ